MKKATEDERKRRKAVCANCALGAELVYHGDGSGYQGWMHRIASQQGELRMELLAPCEALTSVSPTEER